MKKDITKDKRYCPVCKALLGEHDCDNCSWCGTDGGEY